MTRALRLATAATAALVGLSLLVRLANPFGAPPPSVSDYVPHLWGIGALIILLLSQTWAPTLAWTASIVATTASALGTLGMVREHRGLTGDRPEALLDTLLVITLMVPPIVAGAYATADRRRRVVVTAAVWIGVIGVASVLVERLVRRAFGADSGGLPQWAWLACIGAIMVVGLARDLRPAFVRTRARLATSHGTPLSALRVLVDELVPGREAGRAEAVESERGRLAADLHADVLPSLRRALAGAEAGGTVERLAADLRAAVDEVESLLVARRSIVLEEMGLLAAIEWLAERIEERSAVRVGIEVDGGSVEANEERPPREVERAAFRIAQLALDNVVRHAPGSSVRVRLAVRQAAIRCEIEDDRAGAPIDEAAAARSGRRGIADMRAEARACGGALELGRGPHGRGTAVRFHWPD